ncbi:MAG TPA: DOMON-like domain-containing protein [Anaerolineales bacterium]|nr:DOMON-like domain-containing protein [Anaerolineales bacterium]
MTEQSFALIPFPAPALPEITISGQIARRNNLVVLRYSLAGDLQNIVLPARAAPGRKDDLWKATCFEFFIAIKNRPHYWEFNLSPSGDWNVYRMDAYRRVGFREETSFQQLPFETKQAASAFELNIAVDLSPILPSQEEIEAGIAAIIQTRDGSETYWALAHPARQADFHRRESFILRLAAQTHPVEQVAPGA